MARTRPSMFTVLLCCAVVLHCGVLCCCTVLLFCLCIYLWCLQLVLHILHYNLKVVLFQPPLKLRNHHTSVSQVSVPRTVCLVLYASHCMPRTVCLALHAAQPPHFRIPGENYALALPTTFNVSFEGAPFALGGGK